MGNQRHPLHIGIVAGETSGDQLGAGLIRAIREREPDAVFEGIGGPRMIQAGCFSLYPMERLSVMGLAEVVRHLPGLLGLRRELRRQFLATPPDIFIGVDAPDFNLSLERSLKQAGIRTLHYVSPSVWAWRRYRVRKIKRSTDYMLTLFPFEERFYREQHLPVRCVGHPLADKLADEIKPAEARRHLGFDEHGPVVAMLPGSRIDEVRQLAGPFLRAAAWCGKRRPDLQFVVPLATSGCGEMFAREFRRQQDGLKVTVLNGQSIEAMAASNAVLLASGTATLECMLLKRPMVVAYRLSPLTYGLARRLVKTDYIALPNLLANKPLVREFIQHQVSAEVLGAEILQLIENPQRIAEQCSVFNSIHNELRRDANRCAAETVLTMVGRHGLAAA